MSKNRAQPVSPEWSYAVPSDDIENKPKRLKIEASEDERAAVARRLAIVSVDMLKAELEIVRSQDNRTIHVTGRFNAKVTQNCVVTLEPVVSDIEEDVEGWFADPAQAVSFAKARRDRLKIKAGIDVPLLEEREDPEPIQNGVVDLGELVVQGLSLSLPPYPHKEGTKFEVGDDEQAGKEPSGVRKNPFAALKYWKARQEGSENQ